MVVDRPSRSRATCMVIVEPPIRRAPPSIPARSPEQGQRIDAGVPVEIPILVKQHRPHHLGRDLVQPDTDTVFFIFGKAQPEQVPVPIQHQRRKQHAVQKRRFGTQDKPAPERRDRQQQRQHEGESDGFAHMKSFWETLPATKGFHSLTLFWGIALRAMPVNLTVMTLPPFGSDFPLNHTSLSSNHNISSCYIKHPKR